MSWRRGVLVYNPHASTTSPRTRDVIASALADEMKLDLAETHYRAHATEIAAAARADGADVVIALGGDGTANEVVTGLLQADLEAARADGGRLPTVGADMPAFAVVPGGCTNVFARAVGYPKDPVDATGQILEALRGDRARTVSVGLADDRPFLFAGGLGLDAEVVEKVEEARANGAAVTRPLYVRCTVKHILLHAEKRRAPLRISWPGGEPVEGYIAIVANADPWSYLMEKPVRPTPDASYDTGLDVFSLTGLSAATALRVAGSMLGWDARPKSRKLVLEHDLAELTVETIDGEPRALQVDGDHIGAAARVHFRNLPAALRVIV